MPRDVLVVAAHGDDEVLGAGGTLFSQAAAGDRVHLLVVSDADSSRDRASPRKATSRRTAIEWAAEVLGMSSVRIGATPDHQFDTFPQLDFVYEIEATLERTNPTVVYTHSLGDLASDHRVVAQATATA